MRSLGSALATLAAAIVIAVSSAPSRDAAAQTTARGGPKSASVGRFGVELRIRGTPGPDRFRIRLTSDGKAFVIEASSALDATTPCEPTSATAAECPTDDAMSDGLTVEVGEGSDRVAITARRYSVAIVKAGPGDDRLIGGPRGKFGVYNTDFLLGNRGDDQLRGRGGSDVLNGTAGDDALNGGPGDDLLDGRAGHDRCVGGPGEDKRRGCEH
jgi:Ca2+-binding RTX toxin-like protein